MSPEVAGLFRKLADLSPQARERYFADHPVDDRTRRDVEELLAHDSTGGDRFTHIVGLASMNLLYDDTVGKRCGPFRLVSVIGRGGMGVVYLAERADGEVRQRAAVKLMNPGWGDFQRERFLQEREILAALSHANIARLLDAGHLDDGQPYLAMEYVDGRPIHEYCAGFSVRQKIELFLKVCRAVTYLHANSVIHRDLKPSNIVVPADGEPKLLDFGIAKMLDLQTDATITHLRMLTPDYASPEQLGGGEVGKRSDIYSLGIVLHRLLTGKLPGELGKGYSAPELKGDLGRVLQSALRKDPEERYPSVELFAGDLQACLESRPIRARRGNWVYRTKRFVLRHSLSVALTSSLVLALIVVGAYAWNRANSPAALKELRPRRLTSNTPELPIHAAAISPDGRFIAYSDPLGVHVLDATGGATRLLPDTTDHVLVKWMPGGSTLQTAVPGPNGQSTTMLVPVAGGASVSVPNPDSASVSPDGSHRALMSADGKSLLLQDAHGGNWRELWKTDRRTFNGFEWSPDGRRLCLITSVPGVTMLELIDIASGRLNTLVAGAQKLQIGSLVWPVQNRIIIAVHENAAGANSEGGSNLWELRLNAAGDSASGPPRRLTTWSDFPIRPGSLTSDGKKLVLIRSFRQRDVYVAPINPGRLSIGPPRRFTLDLGDDYPTAWTRDSKSVIFTSDRNGPSAVFVQRLDKPTAELLVAGAQSQIVPRLTPDGASVLFYGRMNGKRGLFRSPVTGRTAELFIETNTLLNHRCSPAGPCVIAERQEGTTVVYEMNMKSGKGREIYRDTSRRIATPDVSPDGKWLATASGSNIVIRSFLTGAIAREIPVRGVPNGTNLTSLDYAHDGRGFFAGDLSPTQTRLLHIDLSGKASVLWRQAGYSAVWAVPSPDGKHLAMMVFADDSNVYVLDSF